MDYSVDYSSSYNDISSHRTINIGIETKAMLTALKCEYRCQFVGYI